MKTLLYLIAGLAVYMLIFRRGAAPTMTAPLGSAGPALSAGDIMGSPFPPGSLFGGPAAEGYDRTHTGRPAIKGM